MCYWLPKLSVIKPTKIPLDKDVWNLSCCWMLVFNISLLHKGSVTRKTIYRMLTDNRPLRLDNDLTLTGKYSHILQLMMTNFHEHPLGPPLCSSTTFRVYNIKSNHGVIYQNILSIYTIDQWLYVLLLEKIHRRSNGYGFSSLFPK